MSGPKVINYLLSNNAPLLVKVPTARIVTGALKHGTALPAIAVRSISNIPRLQVAQTNTHLYTQRVQVDIKADSYGSQQEVLALVRAALPRSRGTVANIEVDSILPDIEGPDLSDPEAGIYMQSLDFIVRYIA